MKSKPDVELNLSSNAAPCFASSDELAHERKLQVWYLEKQFNFCLAGKAFSSPRQTFAVWVDVQPPSLYMAPPKNYVWLDRRDGAVRSGVVGDRPAYLSVDVAKIIDLYVLDAARALRQIPGKYLLPDELPVVLECLETARIERHRAAQAIMTDAAGEAIGAAPSRLDLAGPGPAAVVAAEAAGAAIEASEGPAQIVLQWLDDRKLPADGAAFYAAGGADEITALEDQIEAQAQGLYCVDGHDLGSGTINIFLYADDQDAAVARLVALAETGALPAGVRIGAPIEGKAALRAFYPPGLEEFDLLTLTGA